MDSLTGMSVFALVAETRSFTAAGRMLGVSSSAVGKSIARLETKMGVRLFSRSTRTINLTAEGAVFLERCRRILEEVQAAEHELTQLSGRPSGQLRLNVPYAAPFVIRLLSGFLKQFPGIELDIDQSGRATDVVEAGFDAAVRVVTSSDARLGSRTLGKFERILIGSPEYFRHRGTPRTLSDLADHACIHYRLPCSGKLQQWSPLRGATDSAQAIPETVICNGVDGVLSLAKQGLGIACLPQYIAQAALNSGELVRVLGEYACEEQTLSLVWPKARQDNPKLKSLLDYLERELPSMEAAHPGRLQAGTARAITA